MVDLDSIEAWLRMELAGIDINGGSASIERAGEKTDKPAIRLVLEWPGLVVGLVICETGEWDIERVGDKEEDSYYSYSEVPSKDAIWGAVGAMVRSARSSS
jgi:hypothetical protein